MVKLKKLCAIVLVIFLAFSVTPDSVFAAKKAKISKTKATIYVGKTIKLKVKNNKKKVKWSTSNKKVAKVSKKGKVKGIKAGKATITAKVGKKAYKCKITVKKKTNKKSNIKKPVIKPAESETTVEQNRSRLQQQFRKQQLLNLQQNRNSLQLMRQSLMKKIKTL